MRMVGTTVEFGGAAANSAAPPRCEIEKSSVKNSDTSKSINGSWYAFVTTTHAPSD